MDKKIVENYSIYDRIDENGIIATNLKSSACSRNKKGPYYFHLTNGEEKINYINFSDGGNDRKYVWRVKEVLSKYKLKVFFIAGNLDDNTSSTNILEIKCHDASGGGGGGKGGIDINGDPIPEIQ